MIINVNQEPRQEIAGRAPLHDLLTNVAQHIIQHESAEQLSLAHEINNVPHNGDDINGDVNNGDGHPEDHDNTVVSASRVINVYKDANSHAVADNTPHKARTGEPGNITSRLAIPSISSLDELQQSSEPVTQSRSRPVRIDVPVRIDGVAGKERESNFSIVVGAHDPRLHTPVKGIYVASLRHFPVPEFLKTEWLEKLRNQVVIDLNNVLAVPSLSTADTMFEVELCMAGKKTPLLANGPSVLLEPTVWIGCRTRKCKKLLRKAVKDLAYLHDFSVGKVQIQRDGPRPAGVVLVPRQSNSTVSRASGLSTGAVAGIGVGAATFVLLLIAILLYISIVRRRKKVPTQNEKRNEVQNPFARPATADKYSYGLPTTVPSTALLADHTPGARLIPTAKGPDRPVMIEDVPSGTSACGLKLQVEDVRCTIGGLVRVGMTIFALTTAHSFYEEAMDYARTDTAEAVSQASETSSETSTNLDSEEEDEAKKDGVNVASTSYGPRVSTAGTSFDLSSLTAPDPWRTSEENSSGSQNLALDRLQGREELKFDKLVLPKSESEKRTSSISQGSSQPTFHSPTGVKRSVLSGAPITALSTAATSDLATIDDEITFSNSKDKFPPTSVIWGKSQGIEALSFAPCGARMMTGKYKHTIPPSGSDFALIKVDHGPALLNTYQLENNERGASAVSKVSMSGIVPDKLLSSGPVLILVGLNEVRTGYVLEGTSLCAIKGTVFKTRKVELSQPLGMCAYFIISCLS